MKFSTLLSSAPENHKITKVRRKNSRFPLFKVTSFMVKIQNCHLMKEPAIKKVSTRRQKKNQLALKMYVSV